MDLRFDAGSGEAGCSPRALVLTRPQAQSEHLAMQLNAWGIPTWIMPTLGIRPLEVAHAELEWIGRADRLIFISANAVNFGWPAVRSRLRAESALAAVGRVTAQVLQHHSGLPVLFPTNGWDSEALLAMSEWQQVEDCRIMIVRGRGGREWIKSVLESRRAEVHYLECYERYRPVLDLMQWDRAASVPAAVNIQSVEALTNLWDSLSPERQERLQLQLIIVSHARIAAAASDLGMRRIVTIDPGLPALLECWQGLTGNTSEPFTAGAASVTES